MGFVGAAQDMIAVEQVAHDPRTGLPVVSLYGSSEASLSPRPEDLSDLDALVFDIQDIGSRYYTYVWTMAFCMKATQQASLKFIVLDRPNPIGGTALEGPLVAPGFESFVGLHPLPIRHGMTAGEIARWLAGEREASPPELQVVELIRLAARAAARFDGFAVGPAVAQHADPRTRRWCIRASACSRARISPRVEAPPALSRNFRRALHRPGRPGRGDSARPFGLEGLRTRPLWFEPTFQKFARKSCGGLMLHVFDREAFRPVFTSLCLLAAVRELWPESNSNGAPRPTSSSAIAWPSICSSGATARGWPWRTASRRPRSPRAGKRSCSASGFLRERYLLYPD